MYIYYIYFGKLFELLIFDLLNNLFFLYLFSCRVKYKMIEYVFY